VIEPLSSIETEYGFAALDAGGERVPPGLLMRSFAAAVAEQMAWLPAAEGGWFLENGGRLYWDSGGHPEYATPECAGHPRLLVAHVRAGHQILARIVARLRELDSVADVRVWRGNVDYLSGASWGSHENHLVRNRAERLLGDLVPHLVSRVIYGGAGGLSVPVGARPGFCLSPRLTLFRQTWSYDTMEERGIVNLRREDHARGYRRLHLICRDSLISETAELLTTGVSRLVVVLADRGERPGGGLVLDSNVDALRQFASDPTCSRKVATTAGRLSAVEIQRRYLDAIDRRRQQLPDWTGELLALWAGVLDALERDPDELDGVLDWPTKWAIFRRSGARGRKLMMLDQLLSELGSPVDELLGADGHVGSVSCPRLAGWEVAAAMRQAPGNTRARLRGRVIRRYSGNREITCGWAGISARDRCLALDDPYQTEERWQLKE
jgi:proteasome accessory factor A